MKFCLDTNICIYYLNGASQNVVERLSNAPFDDVAVPSMVVAELFYGAAKGAKRQHNFQVIDAFLSYHRIIPFNENAARFYGAIRSELEKSGSMIGSNDLVIAATAMAHDAVLVTHNTKEFSRIAQLKIEDWA